MPGKKSAVRTPKELEKKRQSSGRRSEHRQVRLPPGVPHPVDIHVGDRLRARRTILGYTQNGLAETVGLTFQQIQKYERGINRIGASRLYHLAQVLGVPVGYFFEGLDDSIGDPAVGYDLGMTYRDGNRPEPDHLNRRETLELVRAFYRIDDPRLRKALMGMFRALASASERAEKS